MSATPVIRYTLAGLRKAAPGRSFGVPRCRHPALEAWYRQLHAQILGEKRPVSGRAGRYVYYWAYGRLCWRAYVVPKDPRTAVQRRSRAAFGAASKAWSESRLLTQERRGAWCAAAANTKSAPRLGQSGRLTAQQSYVGQNSLKQRWGLPLLLDPPQEGTKKAECRRQTPESAALAESSLDTCRACAAPAQLSPPPASAAIGALCPSQVQLPQPLTRPSSDRFHTAAVSLPYPCRWAARTPGRLGDHGLPRSSSTLAQIHRNARFRELWRGG
jgi:hypothetical protein